jgi:hypothetical protein
MLFPFCGATDRDMLELAFCVSFVPSSQWEMLATNLIAHLDELLKRDLINGLKKNQPASEKCLSVKWRRSLQRMDN